MFKTLLTRTLAGAVFATLVLGSVFWHPIALAIILFVFTGLGLQEFYRLFRKAGLIRKSIGGILLGLITYSLITAWAFSWINPFMLFSIFPMIFLLFIYELYKNDEQPFSQIALQFLGIIYVAIPFSLYQIIARYRFGYDCR